MQTLASRLPPMKSLVAFEAVARHLSLTRAGEELRISREAVSRQIRVLEEHLGVKLFDRLHRAVALTPAGYKFQDVVHNSLENIAHVASAVGRPGRPHKITVSATVAIASFWLTPRLARFRSLHPDIEIHVAISDRLPDMLAEGIDVGLRYGDGKWSGLNATPLFNVHSFPVCSPAYLKKAPPVNDASDLLEHNLINLDGATHATEDWTWWLREHGVRTPPSSRILGFDSYDNVIQMALRGQGMALGFSGVVADMLADGRLVRPIDLSLTRNHAVYVVSPSAKNLSSEISAFVEWIVEEARLETEGNDGNQR